MATFKVDLSKAKANLSEWPNEFVEATVNDASVDVSKAGNPMLKLEFEIYHPEYGTAVLYDTLPTNFEVKSKAFYQAFHRLSDEEIKEEHEVELDPRELTGATMIVKLGEREYQGKMYKQSDNPWFLSDERTDVLNYLDE